MTVDIRALPFVQRPWSEIPNQYKLTIDMTRYVMTYGPELDTVLVTWRGPWSCPLTERHFPRWFNQGSAHHCMGGEAEHPEETS